MPYLWKNEAPAEGDTVDATLVRIDGLREPFVLGESPCIRFNFELAGKYAGWYASRITPEVIAADSATSRFLEGLLGPLEDGQDVTQQLERRIGEPFTITVKHRKGKDDNLYLNVDTASPVRWG